jgi:hypothetical protein
MRTPRPHFNLLWAIPLLSGCHATGAHSPTLDVLGSYFPAWMICIVIGLVTALLVRLLLISLGIHSHIRFKVLVYPCMAIFFILLVWLFFFKN